MHGNIFNESNMHLHVTTIKNVPAYNTLSVRIFYILANYNYIRTRCFIKENDAQDHAAFVSMVNGVW